MNLVLLLCALVAAAGEFPACLPKAKKKWPASLEALLSCQDRARADFNSARLKRAGRAPPAAEFDALDDFQRKEARRFSAEHREKFPLAPAAAETAEAPAPPEKPQAKPEAAAGLEALAQDLKGLAGDGSAGITPAMAQKIAGTLQEKQGGMTPDMRRLLDALQKDGGKLTEPTMRLLGDSARRAKDQGLDLGVPPDIERELLEFERPSAVPEPAN